MIPVKVKTLHENAKVPTYATPGSSGFDLVAVESYKIPPFSTVLIPTGLAMEIPIGYELQIRPRSGTSLKTNLRIPNSPGTIDSDYRGEIKVIVNNLSPDTFELKEGMKFAQGVICPVKQADFKLSDNLSDTSRGEGGFGSTDK